MICQDIKMYNRSWKNPTSFKHILSLEQTPSGHQKNCILQCASYNGCCYSDVEVDLRRLSSKASPLELNWFLFSLVFLFFFCFHFDISSHQHLIKMSYFEIFFSLSRLKILLSTSCQKPLNDLSKNLLRIIYRLH